MYVANKLLRIHTSNYTNAHIQLHTATYTHLSTHSQAHIYRVG